MSVIRTKAQYETYLEELDDLLRSSHPSGSTEARRLDDLAANIEDYEKERFPFELPTPVEAIDFRMRQMGFTRRDLEPLLGGRSKVSEVLSGKRTLTIRMIRALSQGLGIPTDLLLKDPQDLVSTFADLQWEAFPVKEMLRRRWIRPLGGSATEAARDFVNAVTPNQFVPALFRRSDSVAEGAIDRYALLAWTARVLHLAEEQHRAQPYQQPTNADSIMSEVARCSGEADGPLRAREYLAERGIKLIVESHLQRTRLDGAAMLDRDGQPVVALTIRHDRLDSFWFTLLHELAHVLRHLGDDRAIIADDLDLDRTQSLIEAEADAAARNAFIPRQVWKRSDAYRIRTRETILSLAAELHIHPAVVAGRLRYETDDYQRFGELLGHGEVRERLSPLPEFDP